MRQKTRTRDSHHKRGRLIYDSFRQAVAIVIVVTHRRERRY
jgi:hypothetical protein